MPSLTDLDIEIFQAALGLTDAQVARLSYSDLKRLYNNAGGGGESLQALGYEQVVADQNTISTVVDLTGLSKQVNVPSGHRIKVTGFASFMSSVNGNKADLWIYEGASPLSRGTATVPDTGFTCTAQAVAVLTPSAGLHTYKLRGELGGGTGTVSMKASAAVPAFILIEDLGPV